MIDMSKEKNTIRKKTDHRLNIFSKITEYNHFNIRCHGSSIASWEFQLEQIKILKVYSYWKFIFAYDSIAQKWKMRWRGQERKDQGMFSNRRGLQIHKRICWLEEKIKMQHIYFSNFSDFFLIRMHFWMNYRSKSWICTTML